MAELDRVGIAAVLAADAELEVGPGLAAPGHGGLHELAHAGLVDRGEGVLLHDFELGVVREERAGVVARHAEAGLREVVGAEAEELGGLGNFVGGERAARDLDHGANRVVDLHLLLRHDLTGHAVHDLHLQVEFPLEADERDHDLGFDLDAFLLDEGGGLEDGAGLHLGDLGIANAEPAAAEAEHGIELVELVDARLDPLDGHADLLREVRLLVPGVRKEFMQRRIEEADRHRVALEGAEDAGEVVALVGEDLGEGDPAGLNSLGEDHLAHGVDAVALEEHVLGAAEADAAGAERDGDLGLRGRVGVGPHLELGGLRAPFHELLEALILLGLLGGRIIVQQAGDDLGRGGLDLARVDFAGGAIDREVVAFVEELVADLDGLGPVVDLEGGGTADADLAHLAGDEGGVRGHPAAGGEDAFGRDHAAEILG